MKILGIIGSPRREKGLCHQLVDRILEGAQTAGAETDLLYLIDEEPQYCIHCGHECFADHDCLQEEEATARSRRVEDADAVVLCSPVYCWQPNGLTAALFDKVRLSTGPWSRGRQHGRPALGIAVAGGSGTGVFPALQSIYAWMCVWKYRPLDPLPVTKYNLERILQSAGDRGVELAECTPMPFESTWDQMLTYDSLPFMDYRRVDEFRWLAEEIVVGLNERGDSEKMVGSITALVNKARSYAARGDRLSEMKSCIEAYQMASGAW